MLGKIALGLLAVYEAITEVKDLVIVCVELKKLVMGGEGDDVTLAVLNALFKYLSAFGALTANVAALEVNVKHSVIVLRAARTRPIGDSVYPHTVIHKVSGENIVAVFLDVARGDSRNAYRLGNQVPVRNTKAYLLSVLFNSVSTIDHFYTIQANSEF